MKYETEKLIKPASGFIAVLSFSVFFTIGLGLSIISCYFEGPLMALCIVFGVLLFCICWIPLMGIKLIGPNQAVVLSLFGKYHGTILEPGFYTVNPFCVSIGIQDEKTPRIETRKVNGVTISNPVSRKVSLKINSWDNGVQKVNDSLGNPLELSAIVFWKVVNPTKAVLNVSNYKTYLSSQTDSVLRNVARLHPYDFSDGAEGESQLSLRASSQEVAEEMKSELQSKVDDAGIEIVEVKLNRIAYAPEIAAVMLQRQQASAVIDARKKIVEGAVSMVQMALKELAENNVVEFDEDKKAQMVSNLLVVLCGNKDAQPIVNSGSIY
jgi:Membrane protease subunits, stomatin/prohibitin homologs